MMKRGCEIVFGHVENHSFKEKINQQNRKSSKRTNQIPSKSKLYIILFGEIQRQITIHVLGKHRMIIYRRFMLKILNQIAEKEKAKATVTGDSISQVASQTLENINTFHKASKLPLLAPLVGMNKN